MRNHGATAEEHDFAYLVGAQVGVNLLRAGIPLATALDCARMVKGLLEEDPSRRERWAALSG